MNKFLLYLRLKIIRNTLLYSEIAFSFVSSNLIFLILVDMILLSEEYIQYLNKKI
jgi:hypothetical protein